MRVTEGIDLQGADVGGEECEVLGGRGEHVPRVEVEEGGVEVQPDGGGEGHGEVGEDVVAKGNAFGILVGELAYNDINGCECRINHDNTVDDHGCEIQLLCSLRSVTHTQNKLGRDTKDTNIFEEEEYVFSDIVAEGVDRRVCQRAGDEVEGEVEVGEGEEGEK